MHLSNVREWRNQSENGWVQKALLWDGSLLLKNSDSFPRRLLLGLCVCGVCACFFFFFVFFRLVTLFQLSHSSFLLRACVGGYRLCAVLLLLLLLQPCHTLPVVDFFYVAYLLGKYGPCAMCQCVYWEWMCCVGLLCCIVVYYYLLINN